METDNGKMKLNKEMKNKKDRFNGLKADLKLMKWMLSQTRSLKIAFGSLVVLGVFLSLLGVSVAVISKNLIDHATMGNKNSMLLFIMVFGMVILLQILIEAAVSVLTNRTFERLSNNIRSRMFEKIMCGELEGSMQFHSGDLVTRLTRDIGLMTNVMINVIPDIFSLGFGLVAAFGTLFYYEPLLAVFAFLIGPMAIVFSRLFGRRLRKLHTRLQETEGSYRAFIQETIGNLQVVKAFGLERHNTRRIRAMHEELIGYVDKRSRINAATNAVFSFGYWGGYFMALCWGAWLIYNGEATFGVLAAFLSLVGQVHEPLIGLAYTYPKLITALASATRLKQIDDIVQESSAQDIPAHESAGIVLEGVSFAYHDKRVAHSCEDRLVHEEAELIREEACVTQAREMILEEATCAIKAGGTVALMGPSGEGKTTFVKLLLAFVKPNSGSIYFTVDDGAGNGRIECSHGARKLISYVPQGNTLFSGSIKDNLSMGNPHADAQHIKEALYTADALEFVEGLPDGVNTQIGENGVGLSEGQAQRIAIARAMLKKAPILIFDEATSALDADTEERVLSRLSRQMPGRTCIIITHRPAAALVCDRVLHIRDGKIVC